MSIKYTKSTKNKLQKGGSEWKRYIFSKEDKAWQKEGGKTGRSYTRTQKDMCERRGHKFTRGNNSAYPGCGSGWCCERAVPDVGNKVVKGFGVTIPKPKVSTTTVEVPPSNVPTKVIKGFGVTKPRVSTNAVEVPPSNVPKKVIKGFGVTIPKPKVSTNAVEVPSVPSNEQPAAKKKRLVIRKLSAKPKTKAPSNANVGLNESELNHLLDLVIEYSEKNDLTPEEAMDIVLEQESKQYAKSQVQNKYEHFSYDFNLTKAEFCDDLATQFLSPSEQKRRRKYIYNKIKGMLNLKERDLEHTGNKVESFFQKNRFTTESNILGIIKFI